MGRVNRIQWDSSCNLCPQSQAPHLQCKADGTGMSCVGGACHDCYAQLNGACVAGGSSICAPKVYVAWLGTDKYGQPLLSAGSVLSRFAQSSVVGLAKEVVTEVTKTMCAEGLCPTIGGGADGSSSGAAPPSPAPASSNATS